jgi:hypothetical protein
VALLDERLILPVEKAAVEARGDQPSRRRQSGFINTISIHSQSASLPTMASLQK